jgi:hypothetical protein
VDIRHPAPGETLDQHVPVVQLVVLLRYWTIDTSRRARHDLVWRAMSHRDAAASGTIADDILMFQKVASGILD